MHSIATLRKELGLTTTNQVRNRIEAIKDLLGDQIRRGPNNQILLTDDGLERLRRLQELYDSGLTISEASGVMRADTLPKGTKPTRSVSGFAPYDTKPSETSDAILSSLRDEVARLRQALASLHTLVSAQSTAPHEPRRDAWWLALREEIDAP